MLHLFERNSTDKHNNPTDNTYIQYYLSKWFRQNYILLTIEFLSHCIIFLFLHNFIHHPLLLIIMITVKYVSHTSYMYYIYM